MFPHPPQQASRFPFLAPPPGHKRVSMRTPRLLALRAGGDAAVPAGLALGASLAASLLCLLNSHRSDRLAPLAGPRRVIRSKCWRAEQRNYQSQSPHALFQLDGNCWDVIRRSAHRGGTPSAAPGQFYQALLDARDQGAFDGVGKRVDRSGRPDFKDSPVAWASPPPRPRRVPLLALEREALAPMTTAGAMTAIRQTGRFQVRPLSFRQAESQSYHPALASASSAHHRRDTPRSHWSTSSGVISMTGIAFSWIGSTMPLGSVVMIENSDVGHLLGPSLADRDRWDAKQVSRLLTA
jgi:hypothetical protein